MARSYFTDLRGFIQELERRGKLYRWTRSINKDTELMPLMRVQYRSVADEERKAFLFEAVTDAKNTSYGMKVITGVYGASHAIVALGMGCEAPHEIYEKWHHAVDHPIAPVLVDRGIVQEEVHLGHELQELGLDELPVPVEDPGFSGDIRTTTALITKDPETGIRNVGIYGAHLRARDRMLCAIAPTHHTRLYHWNSARVRNQPLPVAITVGTLPDIVYVGGANLAYGADELATAGGIRGRPVELVRCKTIPLEVPAEAEIVIEGEILPDVMEPHTSFADYPGYLMAEPDTYRLVMRVTAITHRKDAIFTAILVGLMPCESNIISGNARGMMLCHFLKYSCNLPTVLEVRSLDDAGFHAWVIRIRKTHASQPKQILHAVAGWDGVGKWIIVVDEDVNIHDPDMIWWALSYAVQPHQDVETIIGRVPLLDPSAYALMTRPEDRSFPPPVGCSAILVDATRKGPYPPVGLPKKAYMERALAIWQEEELPPPKLRVPWYGYSLGLWSPENEKMAELVAQGEHLKVGEEMAKRQKRAVDILAPRKDGSK